jgi:hypothetical protein
LVELVLQPGGDRDVRAPGRLLLGVEVKTPGVSDGECGIARPPRHVRFGLAVPLIVGT